MKYLCLLTITVLMIYGCSSSPVTVQPCPKITIFSPEKFELSDTEKQLICGDPTDEAYKVVPIYQAKFLLQGFLQSRAFSHPRFIYDNDTMTVYTEEKSHVQQIVVVTDDGIDARRFEKEILKRFKKEELTPKLLDEIEAKAKSMARNESYPCVKVTSIAEPKVGKVTLTLTGLKSFNFGPLSRAPVEGLAPEAFLRFTSFKEDSPFSESELNLTEKRYLRQGVVQGTYFQETCDLKKNEFSLAQDFIVGPPRTIHFGVGASTEVGPMARIRWSHQRFKDMASLLEARLQASLKTQSLNLRAEQFLWKSAPRRSLVSELSYERNDQDSFRENIISLTPILRWTRDSTSRFWLWSAGPSLIASNFKTAAQSDEQKIKTAAILGSLQSQTHSFELFDIHPEEGEFYQFNADLRHPALGFTDPLLKLDLTFLNLHWLGPLGKGSSIGGLRINAATTWVPERVEIGHLPPSVKLYGGGSDDVRGFKLNSLPDSSGLGALSKLSAKLEFRKTHLFEPNLEGFSFLDTAFFGGRPWKLESRLWYSPGIGIRWFSPIGLVQSYLARALVNRGSATIDQDQGNLFFLGLGGVF